MSRKLRVEINFVPLSEPMKEKRIREFWSLQYQGAKELMRRELKKDAY